MIYECNNERGEVTSISSGGEQALLCISRKCIMVLRSYSLIDTFRFAIYLIGCINCKTLNAWIDSSRIRFQLTCFNVYLCRSLDLRV